MIDVLLDALKDSALVFPFLFLIYLILEIIENAKNKEKIENVLASKPAPVFASLLGVIPECGFSVSMAKLYSKGLIATGTLIAAFISASDEGLIILISRGAKATDILLLIGIKIVYGMLLGFLFNVILKKLDNKHECSEHGECIECGELQEKKLHKYFIHPLLHALKTLVYFFVVNFVLGTIIYLIGEDNFTAFINQSKYVQPLIAPLIGLIPNCASSIFLAETYMANALTFSALVGGLSANAGMGLLMVIKDKVNFKKALIIGGILYLAGVLIGYILLPL